MWYSAFLFRAAESFVQFNLTPQMVNFERECYDAYIIFGNVSFDAKIACVPKYSPVTARALHL